MDQYCGARRRALGFFAGALGIALCPRLVSASELTAEAFRDEVLAVGKRRYSTPPMRPGRGRDILWGDHHLYLDNLYAALRTLPSEQREIAILNWLALFSPEADARAQAIKDATNVWMVAKPLLRPKLLPRSTVASAKKIVYRPFSSNLVMAYAIDLGDKDLYVSAEKFGKWAVPLPQMQSAAITNLESMSASIPLRVKTPEGLAGSYTTIATGDGYDAARILLPAFRERLLAALGPSIFAGIPSRDLLMVWSRDFSLQRQMSREARSLAGSMPHALTDEIFIVDRSGVRLAGEADMAR